MNLFFEIYYNYIAVNKFSYIISINYILLVLDESLM